MENLQSDIQCSQSKQANPQGKGRIEDEVNLIDYFRIFWKRKWFILLVSVLPALAVGLALYFWPRDYRIAYTYNIELGEKDFRILEDTFYSTENLEKLVEKLREAGSDEYAGKLARTKTAAGLKKCVCFGVLPSYFDAIVPSKAKNLKEIRTFQEVRGSLLIMRIGAKTGERIRKTASVFRKNFEQIIPLYSEKEELNNKIIQLKEDMACIEETRYALDLQLDREKSTLEKLKASGSEGSSRLPSEVVLQFDSADNSAYLPLPYQIQAAETRTIELEGQIRANKEMYSYYADLLTLNEELLGYVNNIMPSYYTLEQFHSFLTDTLVQSKKNELSDYLRAYIKRIENKMSNVIPLVEKPRIYSVAKGTVKTSGIVFVIALMISIFAAFLLEGLKKSRAQAV